MSEELAEIVEQVRAGDRPVDTVRTLLGRFGFERRGQYKVLRVRRSLEAAGLVTDPDFNTVSIDSRVTYRPVESTPAEAAELAPDGATSSSSDGLTDDQEVVAGEDPAYRVKRLDDAEQVLVTVPPDADLRRATTLMMSHDFSQLPVMTGSRTIKGMISWRSIGQCCALGGSPSIVGDAMETDVVVIDEDASLFTVIPRIAASDYALVERVDGTYWIVTTSDLNVRFRELAEPFLLLSEIENQFRSLLDEHIPQDLLAAGKDPEDDGRSIESAADLTLGEVIRLLERQDVWDRLAPRLDRVEVVKQLVRIRSIRNDVMHFDPEGVGPSDLEALRAFARFLRHFRRWEPLPGPALGRARQGDRR